jgi:hypothetical protein
MLQGWALAHQGRAQEGIAQITQGLWDYRATGAETNRPFYVAAVVKPPSVCFSPCLLCMLCHITPTGLAASCGVETSRLQRPSLRAGSQARHPMLYASFDESWKACVRRPHLFTGFYARPGRFTGRLHQHHGRRLTQHRNTAYASFRTAPSGKTPLLRNRHSAMSNLRATATIPMRLRRLPPLPKRSRNQQLKTLSGW